jgi:Ca-activated chloride channel homolog
MLRRLACLLACLFALIGITEAHASRPMPPHLMVPLQSGDLPIELRKVRVTAEISGGVAQTTVEMEFYNPNRRVLEGELQFPLLPGQEVIGFALDINGKLRDAVPVEKARGQEVFEEIVRRGVDPGLLSATQGNNYKLRVYPLFAQRSRFVRITYIEALPVQGRLQSWRLPLEYPAAVGEFSLRIAVNDAAASPRVVAASEGLVEFTRKGASLVSETSKKDFRGRGVLAIQLQAASEPRSFVQEKAGRSWFVAELPVAPRALSRHLPSRIQLLWDSSASGAERNHAKEMALLDAYFRAVRDADVRLVHLRDRSEPAGLFRVSKGDWAALRTALEATIYDGGTRVDDIPAETWAEEHLLFSDGLVNFGRPELPALQGTLHTVSSALRADPRWLARAAHANGGRFVDLAADTPRVAADKLLLSEERITALAGEGLARLVSESPYAQGGRFLVAGELLGKGGTLRVTLGTPSGRQRELRLKISMRNPRSELAAVTFAKMRIAALEAAPAVHKSEIERLGRSFGLVTRNTSLIVLEMVQDYARFRIDPPEELRAEYESLLAQGYGRSQVQDPGQLLEQIVGQYREREIWWQREFPKGTLPTPVENRGPRDLQMPMSRSDRGQGMALDVARAPVAATVAPSQPAAKAMRERSDIAADAIAKRSEGRLQAYQVPASAPYMARFRATETQKLYLVYLDERPAHAEEAGFYLDVADHLYERGLTELATRVLSNLAEMDLENRHLLRLLAYRLMQSAQWALATPILERVHELAPEEPQSWRDLALAFGREGRTQRAVELLYEVVTRPWDRRFPDVGLVAAVEMNALIAASPDGVDTSRIDPRLLKNLPVDLRVVLAWDADQSNLDLRVQDPNGQIAVHQGQPTYQGGRLSANNMGGYGPEEFVLRTAKPGTYRISVNYAWDRRQAAAAMPPVAQLRVFRNFGTPKQSERIHTVRFQRAGQQTAVGELVIPPDNAAP